MTKKEFIDIQTDLLLKEVEIIQYKITEYDKLSFKIKGWSITLWSAIILWGFYALLPGILISIILGIELMIFWFLDTLFKIYQRYHGVRLEWIQDFINNKNRFVNINLKTQVEGGVISEILLFDINSRMGSQYDGVFKKILKRKTNFFRCFFVRNVFPLYVGLMLVGIYIGLYIENSIFLNYYALIASIVFVVLIVVFTLIHKYIIIPSDLKPCEPIEKQELKGKN